MNKLNKGTLQALTSVTPATPDNVPGGFRRMYTTEAVDAAVLPVATTQSMGINYSNSSVDVNIDFTIPSADLPLGGVSVFNNISASTPITITLPSGLVFSSTSMGNTSTTIILQPNCTVTLMNIATAVAIIGYTAAGSTINVLDPTTSQSAILNTALANIANNSSGSSVKFFINAKVPGVLSNTRKYVSFDNNMYQFSSFGSGIYHSDDGQAYVQSNITSGSYLTPVYGDGGWVAASDNNEGIMTTSDGKTWAATDQTTGTFSEPTFANGKWVIAKLGGGIYTSTNRVNWTQNSTITSGTGHKPVYGNGAWIVPMDGSTGVLYSTDNAVTFHASDLTGVTAGIAIFGNGVFVAGVSNGGVRISENGINWTATNITSGVVTNLYFANEVFVLGLNDVGSAKGIYISDTAATFSQTNLNTTICRGVGYINDSWVAACDDGLYYAATPAPTNWKKGNINFTSYSVTVGNQTFVCGTAHDCYFGY